MSLKQFRKASLLDKLEALEIKRLSGEKPKAGPEPVVEVTNKPRKKSVKK